MCWENFAETPVERIYFPGTVTDSCDIIFDKFAEKRRANRVLSTRFRKSGENSGLRCWCYFESNLKTVAAKNEYIRELLGYVNEMFSEYVYMEQAHLKQLFLYYLKLVLE